MNIILFFLIFIGMNLEHVDAGQNVPRFRDLSVNFNQLVSVMETRDLLLLHPPTQLNVATSETTSEERLIRFVSGATIINATPDQVRDVIFDFDHYPDFMPENRYAKVLSKKDNHTVVSYKMTLKIPFLNMNVHFVLDNEIEPNGDIAWTMQTGDMDVNIGRWELIPLTGNRTLLVMTYHSDIKSIGMVMSLMVRVQPDLEIAIPVSTVAILVDAVKRRAENGKIPEVPPVESLPEVPNIPLISKGELPYKTLAEISKQGTILFIHRTQWIKTKDNLPLAVKFVTSVGIARVPIDRAISYSTSFERYPEFSAQIKSAKKSVIDNGIVTDWQIRIPFAIFNIDLDVKMNYIWTTKNALTYSCVEGDVDYIFGALEYISLGPESTLILFTSANPMGKKAPFLLKFARMIPNSEVVMPASSTLVTIEKMVPWMEDEETKLMIQRINSTGNKK